MKLSSSDQITSLSRLNFLSDNTSPEVPDDFRHASPSPAELRENQDVDVRPWL